MCAKMSRKEFLDEKIAKKIKRDKSVTRHHREQIEEIGCNR